MPFDASTGETVSFSRRLARLGAEIPERVAVVLVADDESESHLTFGEFDHTTNQLARLISAKGVRHGELVSIALPNSLALLQTQWAVWKIGACPMTVNPALPTWELHRLFDVAAPVMVVGDVDGAGRPTIGAEALAEADALDAGALPDAVSQPYRASGTGGSTGLPKLVVNNAPGLVRDAPIAAPRTHLMSGPLYHFGPNLNTEVAIHNGGTAVVLRSFDAGRAIRAIERHRAQEMMFVPTMLKRIAEHPDLADHDLSSVEVMISGGARCPDWLFRRAIELFGAGHVFNGYGGTESIGRTFIDGTRWLQRPGSVGRGLRTEISILDSDGTALPPGEVGEIWMRPKGSMEPTFTYRGATSNRRQDGYATYGDLGWLDPEGYLFIADRRNDMIVTGGANVYPAEVEAALSDHPALADIAVIGLPDQEWGTRIHAVAVARAAPTPELLGQLRRHARDRLAAYKVPKTWEFADRLPRDDLGKLRRWELIDERIDTSPEQPKDDH
jgi:bile acid-coenzyme A ligase